MPHVSLRVTENEKVWMESYARLVGVNLSDAIKNIFFEKLEDEYDIRSIDEYEKAASLGDMRYYSLDETKKELGLDE